MILEKLLGFDIDKLEAMSNEELQAYWQPMLKVTRPELAEKPIQHKSTNLSSAAKTQKQLMLEELKKSGYGHIAKMIK